jgi:hypothetical protein
MPSRKQQLSLFVYNAIASASHFAYLSQFVCPSKHTPPTSLKILVMGRKNSSAGRKNSSAGRKNSSAVMIAYHGKGSKRCFLRQREKPHAHKKTNGA